MESLQKIYEDDKSKLGKAKDTFEDDVQRAVSMRGDLEQQVMLANEQLTDIMFKT